MALADIDYSAAMEERPGVVGGAPNLILRAEGATVLVAATWGFAAAGGNWWLFAVLFLAPDLAILSYLGRPRVGAAAYNAVHTYLLPLALLATGHWGEAPLLIALGLIAAAHIGFDRTLGYGLKYARGFKATHLSAQPGA